MRVFVDVGAHNGETLHVALDPTWEFERIYALEPASACQKPLSGFRDPKLTIQRIGLGDETRRITLHGAGLLGGSIYADKRQKAVDASLISTEEIDLVRASDWFADNLPPDAEVFLKLNCEGSECDILADLLDSGRSSQVRDIYVDFDIRKVPGQEHRQTEIERRLREVGVEYSTPETLGCSGNAGVEKWLKGSVPGVQPSLAARIWHTMRLYASPYERIRLLVETFMPRTLYFWIGRKFGRMARSRKRP
jgi:FkbM family methyltransferase